MPRTRVPMTASKSRSETCILLGYHVLVYGGLFGIAALFWWACMQC